MTSPRLVGFEPQMAAVQGARTYATSRRHGIRLGDVTRSPLRDRLSE